MIYHIVFYCNVCDKWHHHYYESDVFPNAEIMRDREVIESREYSSNVHTWENEK